MKMELTVKIHKLSRGEEDILKKAQNILLNFNMVSPGINTLLNRKTLDDNPFIIIR
jgi:hypothetical protein